jgi:hypothetical protein
MYTSIYSSCKETKKKFDLKNRSKWFCSVLSPFPPACLLRSHDLDENASRNGRERLASRLGINRIRAVDSKRPGTRRRCRIRAGPRWNSQELLSQIKRINTDIFFSYFLGAFSAMIFVLHSVGKIFDAEVSFLLENQPYFSKVGN